MQAHIRTLEHRGRGREREREKKREGERGGGMIKSEAQISILVLQYTCSRRQQLLNPLKAYPARMQGDGA